MENDQDDSSGGVTMEWIESLSQELKDAALLRFFETFASNPTLEESFAVTQEIYDMISKNLLPESLNSSSPDEKNC
ncbi:MAG: hypothetical protein DSM106950_42140 [Stigonema ocellatum SAG 48.90 = DSM 106950]|nr:hypothetical protein [Stigonema ocellatum SAG 48.90 = DSM 106950]